MLSSRQSDKTTGIGGARATTLTSHTDAVASVAFSPDGKTLAAGSGDTTIILLDVSLESWQDRACRIANRNLTRAEWEKYIGDIEPYRATCPP